MDVKQNGGNFHASCVTDLPLLSAGDDALKASDYANALADFIAGAETPVTIGIQGGWGSGKTSLIAVLQEILQSGEKGPIVCVPVNAWENSLFQAGENKAEVALSLLNDLSEGLVASVKSSNLPQTVKDEFDAGKGVEMVKKAFKGLLGAVRIAGRVATQMASNSVGGGDVSSAFKDSDAAAPVSLAQNVRTLRSGLEEMINKIRIDGKPVKVVFFIDDLDRVPPPTAVEVLDITKNIFNIPDCVFVLAIDYEVVVKGLEEKFGKKTPQNEREFRQYFDKIIQIPFTMPSGVYGENLASLLKTAFDRLDLDLGDVGKETLKELAEDARIATGGNPRSIKRLINTLSLLRHLDRINKSKGGGTLAPNLLEARFIIVAMYINYPEVCRRLMENPDYTLWDPHKLNLKWKLNLKENEPQLEALKGEEWCNDPWEKTVYCICSQSDWLKSQARNVSTLLNKLLKVLDQTNEPDKPLSESSRATLQSLLESIRVVSIDLEQNESVTVDDKSVKTDRVTVFDQNLQNELATRLPKLVPAWSDEYAKRTEYRDYEIKLRQNLGELWLEFNKDEEEFYGVVALENPITKKKANEFISEFLENYGGSFEIEDVTKDKISFFFRSKGVSRDDLLVNGKLNTELLNSLAEKTVKLLEAGMKAKDELEELA